MQGDIQKIITPKKFVLNGLILGPKKPKNIFIYLHGLTGNLFSHMVLFEKLIDKDSAVLTFNNRGYGVINRIKQLAPKTKKGYKSYVMGMAHEVFTDCVDDIEGAVKCALEYGAQNIFLVGHSTGCQKSVYYLAKKSEPLVKGAILLAPMSDYADSVKCNDKKVLANAVSYAQKMIKAGKKHDLMPVDIWQDTVDAQRFLSLNTRDSIEEIFTYATGDNPKILNQVNVPLLSILAENDEFKERPISKIYDWFEINRNSRKSETKIIKKSLHSFFGHEDEANRLIKNWVKSL